MQGKIDVHKITTLAIFLAAALMIGAVERYIPISFTVPGVRLGLANVVVLCALYLFSFSDALILVILRCVMSVFFMGSFVSFLYSLSGSVLSLLLMALTLGIFGDIISSVGVSVIGAVFHNIGQLLAAAFVMRTWMIFSYLPALLLSGVLTGVIVGVLVKFVMRFIKNTGRGSFTINR